MEILAPEYLLPEPDPATLATGSGVLIDGARIVAVGPLDALRRRAVTAREKPLPGCLLMAGFVNAHQHGRGLSQVQLGYPDDYLEAWIARRRMRGVLDAYAITRLAAARMAIHGVSTAIHANYSYASGDYEGELRASIRAYLDVGLRVAMCVGAMDQGMLVYPPHEACFRAGLPQDLAAWLNARGPVPYMEGAAATIALMDRLRADFAGEDRVRLFYGPAGPQWVSDGLWRALADDAARHGLGLHLHALESPAQRDACAVLYPQGVMRHLQALGALGERTVIAHGVWLGDDDIEAIARARAIVVRNPGSNLRLRNGVPRMAAMLARSVRLAIGTDNAACDDSEDLLGELRMADLLARAPDWNGAERPSPARLLAMLTTHGGAAAGLGEDSGRIAAGARADMTAIRLDRIRRPYLDPDTGIVEAVLARGGGGDVAMTMVAGAVIHENGVLARGDLAAIEDEAARAAVAARLPADRARIGQTRRLGDLLASHYRSIARPDPPRF